eukprot:PhM_4_TR16628/c0_g1_i1/m.9136
MHGLSVRAACIFLSIALIVCTAVICLSLTLTTHDDAIKKTEQSGHRGLNTAFASAETNIRHVTDDFLNALASDVYHYTLNALENQKNALVMMMLHLRPLARTPSATAGVELLDFYSARERMRPMTALALAYGLSGVFLTTRNGQWIANLQRSLSLTGGATVMVGLFNNATTWGGLQTISVPVDDSFDPIASGIKCDRADECKAVPGASAFSYDPLEVGRSQMYDDIPDSVVTWSNLNSFNSYQGVHARTMLHNSELIPPHPIFGTAVALLSVYVDMSKISDHMASLNVPSGTRVFGVSSKGVDEGVLVGASHGGAKTFSGFDPMYGSMKFDKTHCTLSNDSVVVGVCRWALRQPGHFAGLSPNITYEVMPLNHSDAVYFVKTVTIIDAGLHWNIIAAVPRETVLGDVDATAAQTRATIAAETESVDEDRRHMYVIMYISLSGVVAVLMAASVAFTILLAKPMVTLQYEMAAVAHMDLEAVDMYRTLSRLSEVRSMQSSFLRMCCNLKEYRNYLPVSILAMMRRDADTGSAFDDDEEDDDHDNPLSVSPAMLGSTHSSAPSSENSTPKELPKPLGTPTDRAIIASKPISVMVVNMCNSHSVQWDSITTGANNVKMFESYVHTVLDAVTARHGTPDVFLGDRFLATWNTVKRRATHRTHACHAALETVAQLGTLQINVSVAVASSSAFCGNMGCERMMKYTYIGPCASLVHHLERRNSFYGTTVLVDSAVVEEAECYFVVRKADRVAWQGEVHTVWELLQTRDDSDDEWMYELQRQQKQTDGHLLTVLPSRSDVAQKLALLTTSSSSSSPSDKYHVRLLSEVVEMFFRGQQLAVDDNDDEEEAEREKALELLLNDPSIVSGSESDALLNYWRRRVQWSTSATYKVALKNCSTNDVQFCPSFIRNMLLLCVSSSTVKSQYSSFAEDGGSKDHVSPF